MQTLTHTVVGVDEDNLLLKQFVILGEFHQGMERVGWSCNAHDAEILRRGLQENNDGKNYYILEGKR